VNYPSRAPRVYPLRPENPAEIKKRSFLLRPLR